MDQATMKKVMTFCFLIAGVLCAWVVGVLLDTAAGTFGVVAKFKANPLVQHGLPLGSGLAMFMWLQLSSKNKKFMEEVLVEVSKVVWPSQRDTTGMTIAVSIMILVSGAVFFFLDFGAGEVIDLLLDRKRG